MRLGRCYGLQKKNSKLSLGEDLVGEEDGFPRGSLLAGEEGYTAGVRKVMLQHESI